MLTIRFARVGKKNKAQFRIMLQESTIAPGGRHIEVLGSYNPHSKETTLKGERINYWISKGAQMSDTAYNLFLKNGIIEGQKRKVKVPAKKVEEKKEEASDSASAATDAKVA
jgi:small subunit ribosomal protein S16